MSRTSNGKRQSRRSALLICEPLEVRTLLSDGLNAFARLAVDVPPSGAPPAGAAIHVQEDEFDLASGRVLLGFAVRSADGGPFDARGTRVIPMQGATSAVVSRMPDASAVRGGLILARVRPGSFVVQPIAAEAMAGAWQLEAFLAGDANADFRVDQRDIALIHGLRGTRRGDVRYLIDADVNRNGVIHGRDVRLALSNRGAATSVRPLAATLTLAPTSDPDGNGVVLVPTTTHVGQTAPGATVRLDADRDGLFDQATAADAVGRYEFTVTLAPGLNALEVDASDRFGQHASVERRVRYGDVILDWNASMLGIVRDWTTLSNDPYPNRIVPSQPPVVARNLAMVHAAMYDAVNAIERSHQPYHVDMFAPSGASPVAAAAAAAQRVASSLYRDPDELNVFDAALAEALATVPDGPAETLGVELGRAVADEILAWRSSDGAAARTPYTPGTGPGDWNRTFPDFLPPLLPQWPEVTPFAMTSPSQFRPAPPPEPTSAEYATALNEVKESGRFDSTVRTPAQTEIALFWADGGGTFTPPGHWNQIAADGSLTHGNTLGENARLFALLNIALADAGISAWDAKYAYNLWRPIDAIRRADVDGNAATVADSTWTPLLKTPPFPAYTSGHSTFSGAADAVLSSFFGPNVAFTSTSDGHGGFTQRPLMESQIVTRTFISFAQAADEAGRSRIYGGIHFEFDNSNGLAAGRALGQFVVDGFLRPVEVTE